MRRPGGEFDYISNEKHFLVAGWMLSQAQEWVYEGDLVPIMTSLKNDLGGRQVDSVSDGAVRRAGTKFEDRGLILREWRGDTRPLRHYSFLPYSQELGRYFYIKHEIALADGPENLRERLAQPFAALALEQIAQVDAIE